jgi:hypothetical protein
VPGKENAEVITERELPIQFRAQMEVEVNFTDNMSIFVKLN